ncbi:hypothetical protein ABEB36_006394 [Hypothenemus hampei]|uniref:CUB domain-containing protein n=1 Tax=Hypothenemus hampei TaxID=57062 RepID=A0ABD1EQD8_HYPHA
MVSEKCLQLFLYHLLSTSYVAITVLNVASPCFGQMENGNTELAATVEPTWITEYKNPYATNDPCYRFADITNKEFYSPAYPPDSKTYPSNTNCSVVLTAPKNHVIELDFRDEFNIEKSPDCKNDYLEVRDGQYGFNNVLLHSCGVNEFPPNVRSSNRHLWVYFKSDENIEGSGFRAVFDFVPRVNKSSNPEIIECKKEISYKEEGNFSRDDIPSNIFEFGIKHGLPIDCIWIITVREECRIQLQFANFKLDSPNDCESNFVEVFSNDTINSKKKFCGSIADTVLSDEKHNVLIVRFYSQHYRNKTTFAANFTAFRQYTRDKSRIKNCKENEFDCDDSTCISDTLRCNGFYNCRFRWDEDNCHGSESWALTDDHIVIIMVIFSLILTGMFFTFIYNCVKKLLRDHQTIKEFKRSREQLDKENEDDKRSSKGPQRTPSVESTRFGPSESLATTPCYVPGDDILPILVKQSSSNGSHHHHRNHHQTIYTVDEELSPKMCDSACQTRESLFTTQEYSSGTSTPNNGGNNSVRTDSPPAPFSTFGYNRKDCGSNKFKAEAKIEMHHDKSMTPTSKYDKRYSVQTTKSAPDVIVTH